MIYLLHGADTFRSRRKLREIIGECRQKAGTALEMHRFDGGEDDFARLPAVIGGASLFGTAKKLIVIERPFASARHFGLVRDVVKTVGGGSRALVVLWEGAVGGDAKKMLGEIESLADKTQAFDILQGDKLARWIKKEIVARGFNFSSGVVAGLIAMGGDDLWAVSNEMEKMGLGSSASGAENREMTTKEMTFLLGDTFFTNPKIALRCLLILLSRGEEDVRLLGYLASIARTALAVKSASDAAHPLPPSYKVHPFVLKKTAAAVRGVSASVLARRLTRFFTEDMQIKTGLTRPADALMRMVFVSISRLASLP